MKTVTFTIPCYNSSEYMDKCIQSVIDSAGGRDDIEVIVVDDGSTKDDTAARAESWEERFPGIVRAISKPNGGHGSGVNAGLAAATGRYFKVVDSDDWLDPKAMEPIMEFMRQQCEEFPEGAEETPCDLVIGNYVYEKVHEDKTVVMDYTNVFPEDRIFGWDDIHRFHISQYLLMHSVFYRTQMLRDIPLVLPEHTFYVDNIYVYVPLPRVKTIRYFDADAYRYFIGREDQSVNEKVMMGRMDQQLRVTRIMIDSIDLERDVPNKKLRRYMENYLSMMMCINAVFLRMKDTAEDEEALKEIWAYLKEKQPDIYMEVRTNVLNLATNLPTNLGRRIGLGGYHIAQKIFKFN